MNIHLKNMLDEPQFQTLMNNLSEYIYIVDEEGYIRFINTAAEKFEHIACEDVVGKHIKDVYTQKESPTLKALTTGRTIDEHENIYMMGGKQYHELAKAIPLKHNDKVIGVFTVQRDITFLNQMLTDNMKMQKKRQSDNTSKKRTFDSLLGNHPDFIKSVEIAKSAAENDASVLLCGFTGSGKEVFANAIHNASSRKDKPFLAINCAAVPEGLLESLLFGTTKGSFTGSMDKVGLFEQAEGGTLFLDEINSMGLNSQAKLLRVLEEKEIRRLGGTTNTKINVRIISSINTTPNIALQNNQLREDLFYRLSVATIMIPPLKTRKEDIMLLTDFFIKKYAKVYDKNITGLSKEVQKFFLSFPWPGNIRQLKHVIESAVSIARKNSTHITMSQMPHYLFDNSTASIESFSEMKSNPASPIHTYKHEFLQEQPVKKGTTDDDITPENLYDTIRQKEKNDIMQALIQSGGNVSKAARHLKMDRQALVYRMKKYNIQR